MNVFITILFIFALIGLVDKVLGNKMGLALEFDRGLSLMGVIAVSMVGIYCIGITAIEVYAEEVAGWAAMFPMDPSILIGSILGPDMGALPLSRGLSKSPEVGIFSGIIIASCLGQLISFQFPIMLPALEGEDKSNVLRGFMLGVAAIPVGLLAGGLVMGLPASVILLNTCVILILCSILTICFRMAAKNTERVLHVFGEVIRVASQVMFAIVIVGVFIPAWNVVDQALLLEVLTILFRMVVIICGGLVLTNICLRVFRNQLCMLAGRMHTNDVAMMGLLLNCITSIAMMPMLPKMDANGQKINAAFAVSGAYLLGGQMAFVASVAGGRVFYAYLVSKLTAGVISIAIAMAANKREAKNKIS